MKILGNIACIKSYLPKDSCISRFDGENNVVRMAKQGYLPCDNSELLCLNYREGSYGYFTPRHGEMGPL